MKKITAALSLMLLTLSIPALCATDGIAVIVNPSTGVNSLSEGDVMRLFMGKSKVFPNMAEATPVSLAENTDTRTRFESRVLNKSATQVRAYWAQQIFTGRGTPPKEMASPADVKQFVASTPGAIGYIPQDDADKSVKVVLVLP